MKPVLGLVAAVLALGVLGSLAAPLAAADYDPTSQFEADAPALLSGRTDALVTNSVGGFVAGDSSPSVLLSVRAGELNLSYTSASAGCSSFDPASLPSATCPKAFQKESATVRDATVSLVRVTSAFKVLATNDPSYAESGSLGPAGTIVTTSGASTLLGATPKPIFISPYERDWTDTRASQPETDAPLYQVGELTPTAGALGGSLRATGGLQVLLQGMTLRVTGVDSRGDPYDRTFETSFPRSSSDHVSYLVLETLGGDLRATSTAPLTAYGVRTVDARSGASFQRATGHIVKDGHAQDPNATDLTLEGPLSLTVLNKPKPGDPIRLAYSVSSALRVADLAPPDKPDNRAQLAAAGAAGAGGAALLAGLAYFWPRVRFATTLLFLPLYTRIERTAVLDHTKRDEIYALIRASPGIHAHEIGEKAQIGWGTTVYHLKLLETHSLVVSKRSGRYKRFFVNTGEYTKKKDVYGALRNETAKGVADFIVNHPGCSQKELCAALGIQPSLASWHVEKLEGVELVKRVKDGRMVRYFAGPAWTELNVRVHPAGGADTPVET